MQIVPTDENDSENSLCVTTVFTVKRDGPINWFDSMSLDQTFLLILNLANRIKNVGKGAETHLFFYFSWLLRSVNS